MKKKKIVLYGARLKRYFIHFVVFWSLLMLFNMGLAGIDPTVLIYFLLFLVIGVGGLILANIFTFNDERNVQLTKETVEEAPNASDEELCKAYKKRLKQELRRDALAFLLLAVFVALWILMIKLGGANELTVMIGWCGLTIAFLVLSLALLISSFLPRKTDAPPDELKKYIKERTNRAALSQRLGKPDLRSLGAIPCFIVRSKTPIDLSVCANLKPMVKSTGLTVFLIFLRIFCYGVAFLCSVVFWPPLLFMLASMVFAFIFYLKRRKLTRTPFSLPIKPRTYRRLMKDGVLTEDRILSVLPSTDDGSILEICFEKVGTVQCRCSVPDYQNLLKPLDRTVFLLTLGTTLCGVFCVQEDEAVVDSPVNVPPSLKSPEPVDLPPLEEHLAEIVRSGEYLTDEQVREAALKRLEATEPGQIKAWEEEYEAAYELGQRLSELTPGESEHHGLLSSNIVNRSMGNDEFRHLRWFESDILEEGATREEIVAKKNLRVPFRAYLPLLVAVAILVTAIVVIRFIENNTGAELGWTYVLTSTISGTLALRCATVLLNTFKVKKQFKELKKAYGNPRFWSAMIEIEKYHAFRRRWDDAH